MRLEHEQVNHPEIVGQVLDGVVDGGIVSEGFQAIRSVRRKMLDDWKSGAMSDESFQEKILDVIRLSVICGADMKNELKGLRFLADAEGWGKEKGEDDEEIPAWAQATVTEGEVRDAG